MRGHSAVANDGESVDWDGLLKSVKGISGAGVGIFILSLDRRRKWLVSERRWLTCIVKMSWFAVTFPRISLIDLICVIGKGLFHVRIAPALSTFWQSQHISGACSPMHHMPWVHRSLIPFLIMTIVRGHGSLPLFVLAWSRLSINCRENNGRTYRVASHFHMLRSMIRWYCYGIQFLNFPSSQVSGTSYGCCASREVAVSHISIMETSPWSLPPHAWVRWVTKKECTT